MSTIRRRLTQRLLLGWTLLLLAGFGISYWSARAALTRQFDDTLRAKALALSTLMEYEDGQVEMESAAPFLREFDADVSSAFFQIWWSDGSVVERSKSLGNASLPLQYGTLQSPRFWNLQLPGGLAGRAAGLQFHPRTDGDPQAHASVPQAVLVVGLDRRALERTLSTLRQVLIGCGVLILLLAAGSVPLVLRRELAPLDRLADQTQRINATSLSLRFPTAGLPGELTPISTRLNDLLQRLQTAFGRERQFSDDVAHEFRTPIAELRSLVELSMKWPDTRGAETDRNVLAIAMQMEATINRLLAIARSEQGQMPVASEPMNLATLLATISHPIESRAAARQLTIELTGPPALEIESDLVLLRSILTNLVDNAVEYSAPRGPVRIQTEAQNGHFTVRVSNPVEHLAASDVPRLFERFWRKDAARCNAEHSGLGLSVARALAASLGYSLEAALNGGACLVMTLSGPIRLEQSRK